eukprot:3615405-Rhodomonas_salina.2
MPCARPAVCTAHPGVCPTLTFLYALCAPSLCGLSALCTPCCRPYAHPATATPYTPYGMTYAHHPAYPTRTLLLLRYCMPYAHPSVCPMHTLLLRYRRLYAQPTIFSMLTL